MDIIIDTSAIIAVLLNEDSKSGIIKVTIDANLLAPESIHWEIGNAFSAMFKRQLITLDQALQAIKMYESIPIRFIRSELDASLMIAKKIGIYAYDAYIIQCAIKYQAPILTLDHKLIESAKELGVDSVRVR